MDELARCGLRHAVTSPGSRNAPLLLTLAAERRIRTVSVLDERSAAFVALGIAKASGTAVALTCTSGTAAANFLPALAEAREARVPLIVLTADRPPELREVGSGQSIDQLKLYGSAVKWFVEAGNHEPGRDSAVHHRALACRAFATASADRPGPVHLNFGLREPLAPVSEEMDPAPWQGRPDGRPWVERLGARRVPTAEVVGTLAREIAATAHGAIVCGPGAGDVAAAAARLAAAAGWPLLAEPTSGVRCGAHDRSHVVAHYDALLRAEGWVAAHRPSLVVRLGDTPTSKSLRAWLGEAGQLVVDPYEAWHEPTRSAERVLVADPVEACDALATAVGGRRGHAGGQSPWLAAWRDADATVPRELARAPDPFEPKLYAALAESAAPGSTLWVASSMPIRDVETFFPQTARPLRLLANRGASGIDGTASSALGAAIAGTGRCYLLTGELALLHDLGGLLAALRAGVKLTILCINNGGGGIFHFLPVAKHADPELYEEQIVTPSGVDLERVADLVGLPHRLVETPADLHDALARPGLIEARTDRAHNVEAHRRVFAAVAAALE